jgi:hypothetical protein
MREAQELVLEVLIKVSEGSEQAQAWVEGVRERYSRLFEEGDLI